MCVPRSVFNKQASIWSSGYMKLLLLRFAVKLKGPSRVPLQQPTIWLSYSRKDTLNEHRVMLGSKDSAICFPGPYFLISSRQWLGNLNIR
jgi:hypothetical protein